MTDFGTRERAGEKKRGTVKKETRMEVNKEWMINKVAERKTKRE